MTIETFPFAVTVDSRFILDALETRLRRAWGRDRVFFRELRIGTGYGDEAEGRIDAWELALWPSANFDRTAYEVKVLRSDFLVEMKKPAKRRRALAFSNRFYFATPVGLLRKGEIPIECGLIEVDQAGTCHVVIDALHRDGLPPTWRFLAAIARRVHKDGQP